MSFELINQSIDNIEDLGRVDVPVMLEAINCLLRDIYVYNGVSGIADVTMGTDDESKGKILKSVLPIYIALDTLYEKNKQVFDSIPAMYQTKYNEILPKIADAENDFKEAEKYKEQFINAQEDLEKQLVPLREIQKEVEDLENDNKNKQAEIDRLSDINLDKIREDNKKLSEEVQKRQQEENDLLVTKKSKTKELNDINDRIEKKKTEIPTIEVDINRATADEEIVKATEKELIDKKTEIEKKITDIKESIEKAKQWLDNSGEEVKKLEEEYKELQNQFAMVLNTWNSIINDEFLRNHLYGISGIEEQLTDVNYPDLSVVGKKVESVEEFEKWHKDLSDRIKKLVNIFEASVHNLHKSIEDMNKD